MSKSAPDDHTLPDATGSTRTWVLAATILATAMAFIDVSGFNVTLPSIQADLRASGSQLIWIVNAYGLFLSAFILVGGSLGDRYGRKRTFAIGIVVFAVASLMAGLSPTSQILILSRAVQGFGGALLVPGSLSIITASIQTDRGSAIGTWSAFSTIMTMTGPVLGGFLASAGLWRGFFLINLPLAVLALAILWKWVPESLDEHAARLDIPGTCLIVVALASLSYGAVRASEAGLTDPVVAACLAGGGVVLLAFVGYEARSTHPLLPLGLFRSTTFAGTNAVTLLLYGALAASFFFFPLVLIQAHGYSPRLAGLALLPFSALLALLSRALGSLSDRYGARLPLTVGPILTGIGMFLMGRPDTILGPEHYWTVFMPAICIAGLGMGVTVAPLTSAVMGAVPSRQAGTASGVNNAVARTAGLLAIAFFGSLALVQFRSHLSQAIQPLAMTQTQASALMDSSDRLGDTEPPPGLDAAADQQVRRAIAVTFVNTFTMIETLCGGLAVASGLIALVTLKGSLWPFGPPKA